MVEIVMQRHTIILVQYSDNISSRTFYDFDSVTDALEGVVAMIERRLISKAAKRSVKYDLNVVEDLINQWDIAALVFSPALGAYVPHQREWILDGIRKVLTAIAEDHAK